MAIEESKDLSSLALDELISNLKVHKVVMKKDSKIYKSKKERVKSIALKAKKESSDDETSTFGSDDKEYAMAVRNFKKFFRRKGSDFDAVILIISLSNVQSLHEIKIKSRLLEIVGGCWSDSENEVDDKTNDETCLMAQSSMRSTLKADRSTLKADRSTIYGSVDMSTNQKVTEHVFSPPLSSRLDFVSVRKKLIDNSIENSKGLTHKPSLKKGEATSRQRTFKRLTDVEFVDKQSRGIDLCDKKFSPRHICAELGDTDVIRGIQWLQTLGDTSINWKEVTMSFINDGAKVMINGLPVYTRHSNLSNLFFALYKERKGLIIEM
nr:alpha/beta hydrolases superfamily protein [Tanacetum cinerariifolium]